MAGSTPADGSSPLSVPDACDRFSQITADFTLTDEDSAAAYLSLAGDTGDPSLAAAIQRVGEAFERHDASIPSTEVQSLCP